jgi:hypothetical protein
MSVGHAILVLLRKEDTVTICIRCEEEVSFEDVSVGYYAYCKTHDEDLYAFETL